MADINFDYCCPIILELEGGYVNDPADPGGETNYGISKRQYPNLDIANMTEAQATAIYQKDYWLANNCGQMPAHLDLWYFNACVMSGGQTAVKTLQQMLGGGVQVDGIFGQQTLTALKLFPSTGYHKYLTLYISHLETLPNWLNYKNGWTDRLFQIAAL
jgi:lysozyme family protein